MQTLTELLEEISRLGDREAIRWSNGLRTWVATYRDLYGAIGAFVADFDRRGIGKGERILIWAENRLEWVAAFWACVARGVQAVPVDFRFSPELLERIKTESKPALVIDNAFLDTLSTVPPVTSFEPTVVTPDDIV